MERGAVKVGTSRNSECTPHTATLGGPPSNGAYIGRGGLALFSAMCPPISIPDTESSWVAAEGMRT